MWLQACGLQPQTTLPVQSFDHKSSLLHATAMQTDSAAVSMQLMASRGGECSSHHFVKGAVHEMELQVHKRAILSLPGKQHLQQSGW